MTTFAYLRVSTDRQDVENQRHGILEYANTKALSSLKFVEDTVTGKKKWRQRKLGRILEEAQTDDTIIFAQASRLISGIGRGTGYPNAQFLRNSLLLRWPLFSSSILNSLSLKRLLTVRFLLPVTDPVPLDSAPNLFSFFLHAVPRFLVTKHRAENGKFTISTA